MVMTPVFWLSAATMAASAVVTHLYITGGDGLFDEVLEPAHQQSPSRRSLQSVYASPKLAWQYTPVRPAPPAESSEEVTVKDIWQRLRTGFRLPPRERPAVQKYIDNYRNHPRHIEAILQRGEPYLFYILSRVEAYGLPAELALLPVIESAFDPLSDSPAGAAGIWQFMPGTAKQVGLHQDWWFDGRKDIVAATEAALGYLGELHQQFDGDWLLTLAAYNAGRARVNKAIRRNQARGEAVDFWNLPLPGETREYVPKLIALRAIISNPAAYGITLPVLANRCYFSTVEVDGQLDLRVAARLSGTSVAELQRLNPGLIRSTTPPAGTHRLLVPGTSEQGFRERLARLPADQRILSVRYRIRQGDTLSTIARSSRTTVTRLREVNQLGSTRIYAGKLLIVPVDDSNGDDSGNV